jgi:hypothetical protein
VTTWRVHWARVEPTRVERWWSAIERVRVGTWERVRITGGASETHGVLEGGASEAWRLAGSERWSRGGSEWLALGGSERALAGASLFAYGSAAWSGASSHLFSKALAEGWR